MTRKRMIQMVKDRLNEEGLACTPECKPVAHAAIDTTVDYLIEFAQEVSQELVGVGLYSEAMVAGVFIRKLKTLKEKGT